MAYLSVQLDREKIRRKKPEKSYERWFVCLIFGSMSLPCSLGMWHSVMSKESEKT